MRVALSSLDRWRPVLTGSPHRQLVLLGNFEVEDRWGADEPGVPRLSPKRSHAVENRMDEFALLLAGPDDLVVLKERPDSAYLSYLAALGIDLPRVCAPARQAPENIVTDDALDDPEFVQELARTAASGAHLWPHGVSESEERLAGLSGLPLAAPPAVLCKAVNSKVYSRRAADALGLRQPAGVACTNLDEFAEALPVARRWLTDGERFAIKDAYGVSGKGIVLVGEERQLDQIHRMMLRRAERTGDRRLAVVVERWVPKAADLNYHFTVGRDGTVQLDFIREAVTDQGVHLGHRIPARLGPAQVDRIAEAARLLGARLAADGYFGLVGVDALVDPDGGIYPVIEINARNNMSTYQERLRERFIPAGTAALAMRYLVRPMSFDELRRILDGLLIRRPGDEGLLVNNFATVNAGTGGRLHGIVVAASPDRAAALDREIRVRLAASTGGGDHAG
jgi:D-alanine-D-alanine ligase-like ATP-grasp enzyme